MVKEFLSRRGLKYEERDAARNPAYARELQNMGQSGVPVTVIDGQMVVGYDRARLEEILAGAAPGPSLGAAVADAGPIAERQGLGPASGAYVGRVRPGSPAERLGLLAGDIITEVNGSPIAGAGDLEQTVAGLGAGSRLAIVFLRGGSRKAVEGILQ